MSAPLIIIGEFLYALAHHPFMAVVMGAFLLIARRAAPGFRLFIIAVLIAIAHDFFTGQLWPELGY